MKKTQIALLALVCLIPLSAQAAVDSWRIGLLAGQVGLLGSVGDDDPNSVGMGLTAGFYSTEDLIVEASYISSTHTSVDHRDLSFGVNYYFSDYVAAYPNLAAGVSFASNTLKNVGGTNVSGDAFGFYVGGGFDFELSPNFTTGIQARLHKAFEGKTRVNGVDVVTVDDRLTVMLRILYAFGDLAE